MGDEGRFYSVYTPAMQEQMKRLVGKADVITPNYTEACFLLGEKYEEQVRAPEQLRQWLIRLSDFGPSTVVVTGIPLMQQQIMTMGYERQTGCFWQVVSAHIPARYPGTGDIFASIITGALLNKLSLPAAMQLAADFVVTAIEATFTAGTPAREGVLLESVLPWLGQEWAFCRKGLARKEEWGDAGKA